ncbi:MAG: aminodeoxychorismate/anthranilate synthase component II [Chthoniobacterales bacterium]
MNPLNVLVIDNFDSFTFNLVDEFRRRGAQVQVWRNDISAERAFEIAAALPPPSMILLSPGPCSPREAGCCVELVHLAAGNIPLFGVCLGHQAIVEAFGGKIERATRPMHGKTSLVEHDGTGLFEGLSSPMRVGRYHSLVAADLPDTLRATARTGPYVMALEHNSAAIAGVQFHPESILTSEGGLLLDRVMEWARRASTTREPQNQLPSSGDALPSVR